MPVGVPTRVAISVIITLPKIAFNNPPALPGGGVICPNSAGVIAARPFSSSVHSTRTSHNRPNPVAATDRLMTTPLTMRRRVYRRIGSAPRLLLQPQQQQFGDCQDDKGDDEQDEPQRNQRRQVEIA